MNLHLYCTKPTLLYMNVTNSLSRILVPIKTDKHKETRRKDTYHKSYLGFIYYFSYLALSAVTNLSGAICNLQIEGIRLTRAAEKVSSLFHRKKLPLTCTVLTNSSTAFGKSKIDTRGGVKGGA